jgi:hypothetical protein
VRSDPDQQAYGAEFGFNNPILVNTNAGIIPRPAASEGCAFGCADKANPRKASGDYRN